MIGQLVIKPQTFGGTFSYGIFLETNETFQGIECWQDCPEIFVGYSRSTEGAERAIKELERFYDPLPYTTTKAEDPRSDDGHLHRNDYQGRIAGLGSWMVECADCGVLKEDLV